MKKSPSSAFPAFGVLLPIHPRKHLSAAFHSLSYRVTSSFCTDLSLPPRTTGICTCAREQGCWRTWWLPASCSAHHPQFPYQPSHKLWTIHRPTSQVSFSPRIRDLFFPCQQRPLSQGPEQRIYGGGHQHTGEVDSYILPSQAIG